MKHLCSFLILILVLLIKVSALIRSVKDNFQIFSSNFAISTDMLIQTSSQQVYYNFQKAFLLPPSTICFINSISIAFDPVNSGYYRILISILQTQKARIKFSYFLSGSINWDNNKVLKIGILYWDPVAFTDLIFIDRLSATRYQQNINSVDIERQIPYDLRQTSIFCLLYQFDIYRWYSTQIRQMSFSCTKKFNQNKNIISANIKNNFVEYYLYRVQLTYLIFRQQTIVLKSEILYFNVWQQRATTSEIKKYSENQALIVSPTRYVHSIFWSAVISDDIITSNLYQYDYVSYICVSITPKQYREIKDIILLNSLEQNQFQIISDNYQDFQLEALDFYITPLTNFKILGIQKRSNFMKMNVEYQDWYFNQLIQFSLKGKTNIKINQLNEYQLRYKFKLDYPEKMSLNMTNQITQHHYPDSSQIKIIFNVSQKYIDLNNLSLSQLNTNGLKLLSLHHLQNQIIIIFQYNEVFVSQTVKLSLESSIKQKEQNKITLSGEIYLNKNIFDVISFVRLILEVCYLAAFVLSFKFRLIAGVDLVFFIQLVFYAQKPFDNNQYLSGRLNQYYHFVFSRYAFSFSPMSLEERILNFMKFNSYLALSILLPLLIATPLFIHSKRIKAQGEKQKYTKWYKTILIQWTFSLILFNIYNIIVNITLNFKLSSSIQQTIFLCTSLSFLCLPSIFAVISRKFHKQQFFTANHYNKNQRYQYLIHYLSPVIVFTKVYIIPLSFQNLYALLVLILFVMSYDIMLIRTESLVNNIKVLSQRGLEIVIVLIYIAAENRARDNSAYFESYWFNGVIAWVVNCVLFLNLMVHGVCEVARAIMEKKHKKKTKKKRREMTYLTELSLVQQQQIRSIPFI